jgi:hypothetical protein
VHQLTIDHANAPAAITAHPSFEEAHRALLTYAIDADYYLWVIGSADFRTRYQLLRLADPGGRQRLRRPYITGTATIQELPDRQCRGLLPATQPGTGLGVHAP